MTPSGVAQSERHPTELANLRALRLAISSEVPEGAHWNESRIKSLTGDASISARYMRADYFEFARGHKHLVYGNHRPLLRVVDDAMRARMHVVPFRAVFSDELGNRDPMLPAKLRAEAPAILARLIDGHLQWIADGSTLRKCDAVKRETADYFESQSTPDLWTSPRAMPLAVPPSRFTDQRRSTSLPPAAMLPPGGPWQRAPHKVRPAES
jgi:putative DNA primase/helicase